MNILIFGSTTPAAEAYEEISKKKTNQFQFLIPPEMNPINILLI